MSSSENNPAERDLTLTLPHPRAPPDKGPKENPSTTHPKHPPIKFPHYQYVTPGTDPMTRPHPRIQTLLSSAVGQKDSHPEPSIDHALASSSPSQEHVSQVLLPSHGHNDRDVSPTECDLRHQMILSPPRVIFNKTSKSQTFAYQAQPRHVPPCKQSHTKRNRDTCPALLHDLWRALNVLWI